MLGSAEPTTAAVGRRRHESFAVDGFPAGVCLVGRGGSATTLAHARSVVEKQVRRFERQCEPEVLDALAAGVTRHPIDLDLVLLLSEAVDAAELTEGFFDAFPGVPAAWRGVQIHPPGPERPPAVTVPAGVRPHLGSLALAVATDVAASELTQATGLAVLVTVGPGIATAGPCPDEGWRVEAAGEHIVLLRSALAHAEAPAGECWSGALTAAPSCALATVAGRAAVAMGERAPAWLEQHRLPTLLLDADGARRPVAGW